MVLVVPVVGVVVVVSMVFNVRPPVTSIQ